MLFFFKQKTAYEMRISDWSSDVCSSDLEQLEQRSHEGDNRKHGRAEDDSGDEVFATEIETRERVRREHADDQGDQRGRASDDEAVHPCTGEVHLGGGIERRGEVGERALGRSDERRDGNEGDRTWTYRGSPPP